VPSSATAMLEPSTSKPEMSPHAHVECRTSHPPYAIEYRLTKEVTMKHFRQSTQLF
jgi:hypothetical protein